MPELVVDEAYWTWKASILPQQLHGSVLDVGCYQGHFSYLAKERGAAKVVGIEPPIDNIEADYDSLPRSDNGVVFKRQSLYNVRGKYDHILFFDVLYHLVSPVLGLQALKKALAKDGQIYLCSLFAEGNDPVLYALEHGWSNDVTNWFVPTLPAIERMCDRVGLTFEARAKRGDRVLGLCRHK